MVLDQNVWTVVAFAWYQPEQRWINIDAESRHTHMGNEENVKFIHHLLNKMLDYSAKTDDVKCKMRRPCPTGMLWMTPTKNSRGREQGWYIHVCNSQRQCHSILSWWSQGKGRSVWYRISTLPYSGNQTEMNKEAAIFTDVCEHLWIDFYVVCWFVMSLEPYVQQLRNIQTHRFF